MCRVSRGTWSTRAALSPPASRSRASSESGLRVPPCEYRKMDSSRIVNHLPQRRLLCPEWDSVRGRDDHPGVLHQFLLSGLFPSGSGKMTVCLLRCHWDVSRKAASALRCTTAAHLHSSRLRIKYTSSTTRWRTSTWLLTRAAPTMASLLKCF